MIAVTRALDALPSEIRREIADATPRPSLSALLSSGLPGVREAVEDSLRAWCAAQTDARDVLRTLTAYDRRLGVWLACQVARTALRYVPEGEPRPRVAIETAERWCRGEATAAECRRAYADADAAADAAYAAADAADAAYAAADAAYAAADAAYAASAYAAYAAANAANAAYAAIRDRDRADRLRALCGVCAEAIRGALDAIGGAS